MKFLSVCSGIEAASVAWNPLGWKAVGFSEIEPFPCSLLAHRYPSVPNFGDLNGFSTWSFDKPDLIVGGTPCQSFSVAGLRAGLADPRGQLALVYLGLVDRVRPKWIVWENVPGVLSSGGGRDFGSFLGALAELGYGWAYRVLDAQYFGLAQRRKRVFVVGCLGDWRRAAAVLFESASLRGDPAPSREAGETVARSLTGGSGKRGWSGDNGAGQGAELIAHALNAGACNRIDGESETFIAFHARQDPIHGDVMMPLEAKGGQAVLAHGVRRLTPRECERLQGFPDDWTAVPHRGKPAADGPRYKALGNSIAVPVLRWIGERIEKVSSIL